MPEKHKFEKVAKSVKARIKLNPETTPPPNKIGGDGASIAQHAKPTSVKEENEGHIPTLHPVKDYLFKHYKPDPEGKVGLLDMYQHYASQGDPETVGHVSLPTFARSIDSTGIRKLSTGKTVHYLGLSLKNEEGENDQWPSSTTDKRPRLEPLPEPSVRQSSLKPTSLDQGRKVNLPYIKPPTDIMPVQEAQRSFKIHDDGTTSGSVDKFRNIIAGNSDALADRWDKNKTFFHNKINNADLHASAYEGPTLSSRNPAFKFVQRNISHIHNMAAEYNSAKYSDNPDAKKFGKSPTRAIAALYVAHVIEKNPNLTHNRYGTMPDPESLPKKAKSSSSVMAAESQNYKVSAIVKILKERVNEKERETQSLSEKIEDYYIHALYLKQDIDGPDIRHEVFRVPAPTLKENRLAHMKPEDINSHIWSHDRTAQLKLDGYKPLHAIGSYKTTSELAEQLASDYLSKHKEASNAPLIHEETEIEDIEVIEEGAVGKWIKKKVKKAVKNGKKGLKKAIVGSGRKGKTSNNKSFVKKAVSSATSRVKKSLKGKK